MKKFILIIAVSLLMLLILSSCSNQTISDESSTTSSGENSSTSEESPSDFESSSTIEESNSENSYGITISSSDETKAILDQPTISAILQLLNSAEREDGPQANEFQFSFFYQEESWGYSPDNGTLYSYSDGKYIPLSSDEILFLNSVCGYSSLNQDLPEETNLDFWICQDVTSVDFSSYLLSEEESEYRTYLGKEYTADDSSYVVYTVSPWPDTTSATICITAITVTDPDVTICGLTIQSDYDSFQTALSGLGYTVSSATIKNGFPIKYKYEAVKDQTHIILENISGMCRMTITAEINYIED